MSKVLNSKLTKAQKIERKAMIVHNPEMRLYPFLNAGAGAIVACKFPFPGAKIAQFAVAICSPDEQKFRYKVGEFHAMQKLLDGQFLQVPCNGFDEMAMMAEKFANMVAF
jgi:hypothetical protein